MQQRSPPSFSYKEGIMNMFTVLAIVAALGAVTALVFGIGAMTQDGEVGHRKSEVWMGWRVAFQALALALLVLGFLATANAAAPLERECVYDYSNMSAAECRAYRYKVLRAKTDAERIALRNELHRAREARTVTVSAQAR